MQELKFYKFAVLGLLILNFSILAFFLLNKPSPPHHKPPRKDLRSEVTKIFTFSDEQQVAFNKLAEEHHSSIKAIEEKQNKLVSNYFESLLENSADTLRGASLSEVKKLEQEKLEVTYQHFIEIKGLLNEDQIPHFQSFITRVVNKILGASKKPPPLPKGF